MDLKPTEEQQAIIEALHDFAENEIRPAARECEEQGEVSERIVKQLHDMGVAAPIPEDMGGQGTFDTVTSVLIAEELAWGDPGIAFSVLIGGLPATLIDLVATDEQRRELLPTFIDQPMASFAFSELDAGNDFTVMETTADGSKLTGLKYAVPHADSAAVKLAVASGPEGPGLFLLPEGSVSDAKPEDKLGLRAARTFKVPIDTSDAQMLGSGDQTRLSLALSRAKLLYAGIALGLARAALEYATTYAQERTAFGRPIGAFQGISFKIADRAMDIEAARLLVWRAAWDVDRGNASVVKEVFAACGHAVTAAVNAGDDGVQILGGHGYMRDHPEELWYRDAMTLAALDSPDLIADLFDPNDSKAGA